MDRKSSPGWRKSCAACSLWTSSLTSAASSIVVGARRTAGTTLRRAVRHRVTGVTTAAAAAAAATTRMRASGTLWRGCIVDGRTLATAPALRGQDTVETVPKRVMWAAVSLPLSVAFPVAAVCLYVMVVLRSLASLRWLIQPRCYHPV
uniref:Secreted protein n=1 Tax=Ixodes ricinus TaxID=34613 RepID=A0A147BEA5_IXORI